ncbi:MAG: hypothetical protein ABF908_05580, partial [Lentilactobacillus diolivorans]
VILFNIQLHPKPYFLASRSFKNHLATQQKNIPGILKVVVAPQNAWYIFYTDRHIPKSIIFNGN